MSAIASELVGRSLDAGLAQFDLCSHRPLVMKGRSLPCSKRRGPFLMAVTINGADARVKGPQWNRLIQTLDRGSYDVGIVLRTLKRLGFPGPIGLQGHGLTGDRRDNLARSMEGWKRLSAIPLVAEFRFFLVGSA